MNSKLSPYSLALFRILMGLVLLTDLTRRLLNAEAHYSNQGIIFQRAGFFENFSEGNLNFFSLFEYSVHGAHIHLGLQLLFALLMLVGFHSRVFIFLGWIFQLSLQNQNIFVLYSGDVVIRQVLFLSLFLNLDQKWSLKPSSSKYFFPSPLPIASFIGMIYFFNAYEKLVLPGWIDGIGFFDGLGIEHMVNDLGRAFREWTILMKPMNYLGIAIEIIGPLTLWFFYRLEKIRTGVIFLFIGYHFVTRIFFYVGLFPEIMYACWTIMLPHSFWKKLKLPDFVQLENKTSFKDHLKTPAFFVMLYFILLNGLNLYMRRDWAKEIYWNPMTKLFKFDQRWDMFRDPGKFVDGWIDLQTSPEMKPRNQIFHADAFEKSTYYQHRWIKLMMNAAMNEVVVQKGLVRYFCQRESLYLSQEVHLIFYPILKESYPSTKATYLEPQVLFKMKCPTPTNPIFR